MPDLFDGVKPPKEPRERPEEPPARETAPATDKKPSGVPASRLWGWAVPLLAVVLVIVLWSISVWLLIAAALAAVVGLVITAVARWWQRRSGRTTRTTRTWTTGPTGRTGVARGLGLGGRSRRGGDRTGSGSGRGSRWNPIGRLRGSGRSAKGSTKTSGQAAGSGGHTGRPTGRLRSWLGTGRWSANRAGGSGSDSGGRGSSGRSRGRRSAPGAGGSRGSRGAGSKSAAPSGAVGARWSRSRANPSTWVGPRRAAAKAEREAWRKRKEKKDSGKQSTSDKKADDKPTTEGGKHRWRWLRRKKTVTGDTKADEKAEETKSEKSKQDKKKENSEKKTDKPKAKHEKKPEAKPVDDFEFDDMGFPIAPDPNWKPTPRPAPKPLNVDDGGFISPPAPKRQKPKPTKHTQRRDSMSDRTQNPYAEMIDPSSPETFRASTHEAAQQARADATKKEEEASALRSQAAAWQEKGMDATAEPLLREAARLEETAAQRRQAAAAYESV